MSACLNCGHTEPHTVRRGECPVCGCDAPSYAAEVVPIRQTRFRQAIPEIHQQSLDTRLQWLWHQRFGTVQMIWKNSADVLDKTACTLILQAIMAQDLQSIALLFHRIEGGAINDDDLLAQTEPLRV